MQTLSSDNSLRQYARDIGSEPSDFINTLSDALGQSIWLCNGDFDIVWGSSNTGDIIPPRGLQEGSEPSIDPSLREFLKGLSTDTGCTIHKGVFKDGDVELGVTVLPVVKGCVAMGFIVTVAEGIGAKLIELTQRQKERERCWDLQSG